MNTFPLIRLLLWEFQLNVLNKQKNNNAPKISRRINLTVDWHEAPPLSVLPSFSVRLPKKYLILSVSSSLLFSCLTTVCVLNLFNVTNGNIFFQWSEFHWIIHHPSRNLLCVWQRSPISPEQVATATRPAVNHWRGRVAQNPKSVDNNSRWVWVKPRSRVFSKEVALSCCAAVWIQGLRRSVFAFRMRGV